jgi:hypothetical protein
MAGLQTVVGRLRLQSSTTVHGRLQWRVAWSQTKRWHDDREKLLVVDTGKEEFGCMALPQLHLHGEAEAAAVMPPRRCGSDHSGGVGAGGLRGPGPASQAHG